MLAWEAAYDLVVCMCQDICFCDLVQLKLPLHSPAAAEEGVMWRNLYLTQGIPLLRANYSQFRISATIIYHWGSLLTVTTSVRS